MKILFVTPFLASPPRFGAERRLDGLARELARHNEISLLWFDADDHPVPTQLGTRHDYCQEVATVPSVPGVLNGRRLLQFRSLFSRSSFETLQARRQVAFQRCLSAMVVTHRYDVVQFESARVATFDVPKRRDGSPVLVLDEHNIEYDLARRVSLGSHSPARRLYAELNWRKLARDERAAWRRVDGVALTSERDRALLLDDVPEARSLVVPNGVDLDAFTVSSSAAEPFVLLFFGALNYFPNERGLLSFIDQALPEIKRRNPLTRLLVVGPGAPPSIQSRHGGAVEVIGEVDDVRPFLDRASAVVVPIAIGGGTRLKIIEAWAKGKAVVSTRVGAEGLGAVDEQELLIADTMGAFVRQVERVLQSPELARRLGSAGRQLVETRHGWPQIAGRLQGFYDELHASRRQEVAVGEGTRKSLMHR